MSECCKYILYIHINEHGISLFYKLHIWPIDHIKGKSSSYEFFFYFIFIFASSGILAHPIQSRICISIHLEHIIC